MDIEKLKERSKIIHLIRQWFDNQGFLEMHTPRLVGLPGQEPYLEPFWTDVTQPPLDKEGPREIPFALITSPEYSMKKLLGAGMDKIYDLGPCFRNNEPWDGSHDPEFLMLEWYRRDAGVNELMDDTESMIRYVVGQTTDNRQQTIERDGQLEQLSSAVCRLPSSSFRRLTVEQAWREYAGVELAPLLGNREAIAKVATEKFNQPITPDDDWDDIYFKIFLSQIEPKLTQSRGTMYDVRCTLDGVFLYRYPVSQASLARKSANDPRWAERVEFYMGNPVSEHGTSFELANGFAELCDPEEQRQRFVEEQNLRKSKGKKTWPIDEDFIKALPGMGNAAGIAFGVERLVMLLTNSKSINEILPFSAGERFGK
ncbi:MAG: amino acid--tRNA ligase-related protein [Patescibacteria group bacterium]|jgi:lysyl-tRNA synthetase class 2